MLSDIYYYADEHGIDLYYYPMRQATAMSFPDGTVAIDVDKIETSAEEATILAHEIGHIATGYFYNISTPLLTRSFCEGKAHRWAIKKLLPASKLQEVIEQGIQTTWELAEHFGVTEQFVQEAIQYYKGTE